MDDIYQQILWGNTFRIATTDPKSEQRRYQTDLYQSDNIMTMDDQDSMVEDTSIGKSWTVWRRGR